MAYRFFRSEKCSARDVRKVTTGITGLWQPSRKRLSPRDPCALTEGSAERGDRRGLPSSRERLWDWPRYRRISPTPGVSQAFRCILGGLSAEPRPRAACLALVSGLALLGLGFLVLGRGSDWDALVAGAAWDAISRSGLGRP